MLEHPRQALFKGFDPSAGFAARAVRKTPQVHQGAGTDAYGCDVDGRVARFCLSTIPATSLSSCFAS